MKKSNSAEKSNEQLQIEAAKALLSQGVKFSIQGIGNIEIKPLTLRTLLEINKEAVKIKTFDKEPLKVYDIIERAEDAYPATRIIALAILQGNEKRNLFTRISNERKIAKLQNKLIDKLTAIELKQLVDVILTQANGDFFLSCISQLGALRILEPVTKGATVSGVQ